MSLSITHDPEADAAYIRISSRPYAYGQDLDDSRRIDLGADREPIGVELLNVSHGVNIDGLPRARSIARLLEEHHIPVVQPA